MPQGVVDHGTAFFYDSVRCRKTTVQTWLGTRHQPKSMVSVIRVNACDTEFVQGNDHNGVFGKSRGDFIREIPHYQSSQ